MPRLNRSEYLFDNCLTHVRIRFNNEEFHFKYKQHYQLWEKISRRYLKKYKTIKLCDFSWMSNHAHFVIKVKIAKDLSCFMHDVCWRFALEFNKLSNRKGHIFHERFQCSIIYTNEYVLHCQRYIYRNQLRAGMVENIEQTQWSSYHFYAWGKPSKLLSPQPYDEMYFHGTIEQKQKQFREYVRLMTRKEEENTKLRLRNHLSRSK